MDITLLKLVVVCAVFDCTVIKALQLTPNGAATLVCGMQQQLICTSSFGVTWSKGTTALKACSSTGLCINPVVGHYNFTHNGSSFIMTFDPIKSVDDGATFTCADTGGGTGSSTLTVKAALSAEKIIDLKDGSLQLDAGCFDPTDENKITVSWECEDKNSGKWINLPSKEQEPFVQSLQACNPTSDCPLASYKRHTKKTIFKQCDSCKLKVRAKLTNTLFSSIQPVSSDVTYDGTVPIEDFNWKPYQYAVWALFIIVVLKVVLNIPWLIFHHDLLLVIVNYANYITLIWSLIMVCLIYTAGKGYCSETPDETGPLAIVSLIVSVIIRILILILLCADKMPVKQLKGYAITLKQLHCCGCQKPDKQNSESRTTGVPLNAK